MPPFFAPPPPTPSRTVSALNFAATIIPWNAQCQPLIDGQPADCPPPIAADAKPATLPIALTLAASPGQASQARQSFRLDGDPAYSGQITLYSVDPQPGAGFPPYIQVRVDLDSPARATCAESVRLRDPMELPPMICAAFVPGEATQAGVTISFASPDSNSNSK